MLSPYLCLSSVHTSGSLSLSSAVSTVTYWGNRAQPVGTISNRKQPTPATCTAQTQSCLVSLVLQRKLVYLERGVEGRPGTEPGAALQLLHQQRQRQHPRGGDQAP